MAGLLNVALPMLAASLGHTPRAMVLHVHWLTDYLRDGMPTTKLQWGAAAITAAFTCLLLGGALSWWCRAIEQRNSE